MPGTNIVEAAIADSLMVNADGNMQYKGNVANALLASGFNVNALRTNATLRKDEWVQYDTAVVEIARSRLVAVGDLMAAGLSYNLANGLGTTVVQWEKSGDMTPAEVNMSGLAEAENDNADYTLVNLPIPITHKDFKINVRALEASRRTGETLDTTQAAFAGRVVAEKIESSLFNGAAIKSGGGTVYGYTNFPSRNTGSVTASWNSTTGANILIDVLAMIAALQNDNMYGPYVIYVSTSAYLNMQNDFKTNSDRTILERVLGIPDITAVRPSSNLAGNNVLMVQMTSDVVDMVVGMQPTTVQWDSHGGMLANFKVMSIMVPRLKSDADGRCGIAHFS